MIAEELTKDYDGNIVFQDAHFTIEKGEKVAFVGRNGEGKSTLVKCIMGEIPYNGKLTLGYNVKIGYFAQNQASLMDESLTVFPDYRRRNSHGAETQNQGYAGSFHVQR